MSEFDDYRIEGVIKAANKKAVGEAFNHFLYQWQGTGTIVTNPDPTGMSLYKVEEVEGLKSQIERYHKSFGEQRERDKENDKRFLEIAAQLEQKDTAYSKIMNSYRMLDKALLNEQRENEDKDLKIKSLETKLRLKENTRWKTFIKWVKEKVRNR